MLYAIYFITSSLLLIKLNILVKLITNIYYINLIYHSNNIKIIILILNYNSHYHYIVNL